MAVIKDLTGKKYTRLTIIKLISRGPTKWECLCDCGNITQVTTSNLNYGYIKSCGCLSIEMTIKRSTTHGKTNTKEHRAWSGIRQRCYDKKCKNYEYYGARGISMSDKFKDNFEEFLNEIGNYPEDGLKYTVERINNDLGYIENNIVWELFEFQTRNRRKMKNNTSGTTGVRMTVDKRGKVGYLARWVEDSKSMSKYFSVNVHGLLPAFVMAIEYREAQIKRLNELGYGYSDNHGK